MINGREILRSNNKYLTDYEDAIFAAFVEGGDNSPLTDVRNALRRHIFEPDPEMDPTSPEYLGAGGVGAGMVSAKKIKGT